MARKNKWNMFFIFIFLFLLVLNLESANNIYNNGYHNYSFCISLIEKKEGIDEAWGVAGGVPKVAYIIYGNNSYFSWINVNERFYPIISHGCKGVKTIGDGSIVPVEATITNNSLYFYGINIGFSQYLNIDDWPTIYMLLNESIEDSYSISIIPCEESSEGEWIMDTHSENQKFPLVRPIKKTAEFSFKWILDEESKKKILDYFYDQYPYYSFVWDNVSENNTYDIKNFLFYELNHQWVRDAEIKKSNNKTVTVTKGSNFIEIYLKKENSKVIIKMHGSVDTYEYPVKEEDGHIVVYSQEKKILKTKDNKNIIFVGSQGAAYIFELMGNECVLKQSIVITHKQQINISKVINNKSYLLTYIDLPTEFYDIIETQIVDKDVIFIKARYKDKDVMYYLVINRKNDKENISDIVELRDVYKFKVINESGEIKVKEFENPMQHIDAVYIKNSTICFEYSDDGKQGRINFDNKTIYWKLIEGVKDEEYKNNILKITLEGGENTKFFPFLITKNETLNETIIYGILLPCNLSEIYNLELKNKKLKKYVNEILSQDGFSFLTMFKIIYTIYHEKIYFDKYKNTKNYTLTFKFDNFDKKEQGKIRLLITKVLPEEQYKSGRCECINNLISRYA